MAVSLADTRRRQSLAAIRQELEWRRMRDDFVYFCESSVLIERKDKPSGYGLFEMAEHQKDLARLLSTRRRVINLKGRQLGISTELMAWFLWRAMRMPGFKGLVLSHKDEYAKATLERLRLMFMQLPDWLRDRFPEPNDAAGNFTLDFGRGIKSVILSMPVTKKVGASLTLDAVFFDEAALAEYAGDAYASLAPTLDAVASNDTWPGAVIVVASTARGSTNWFASTWRTDATFAKAFYPWTCSPYYSQRQYDADLAAKRAAGEEHLHYQERPANPEEAFRKSGRGRFPMAPKPEECPLADTSWLRGELVRDDEAGNAERPAWRFVAREDGNLRVAELPDANRDYVLSVDPSKGVGRDYTAAHVLAYDDDGLPYIAAYWHANDVEGVAQAHAFDALGRFYGKRRAAWLVVEDQGGHGGTILTVLRSLHYPRIYRYTPSTTVARKTRAQYGFPMAQAVKPRVIDHFAQVLPDLGNVHYALALELSAFVVKDNNKMEADDGAHDDLVMSAAIGCWVLGQSRRNNDGAPTAPIGDETATDPASASLNLQHLFDEAARARAAERRQQQRAMDRITRRSRAGARRR